METLFVALIADGVFVLSGSLVLITLLITQPEAASMSSAQLEAMWMQGNWQGAGLIVACLPTIGVLWIAVRMARREFVEYLALRWPNRSEVLSAFAIMAILLVAESVVATAFGAAKPPTDYLVVKGAGGLLTLLIGFCIAAPILEELVVRGFMFRGWSESFLGPIGAIVLTSAVWAMQHTQYDWFGRLEVFLMGLAFGHFRWRSNSTWLTVMVHSAVNTGLLFLAGPYS